MTGNAPKIISNKTHRILNAVQGVGFLAIAAGFGWLATLFPRSPVYTRFVEASPSINQDMKNAQEILDTGIRNGYLTHEDLELSSGYLADAQQDLAYFGEPMCGGTLAEARLNCKNVTSLVDSITPWQESLDHLAYLTEPGAASIPSWEVPNLCKIVSQEDGTRGIDTTMGNATSCEDECGKNIRDVSKGISDTKRGLDYLTPTLYGLVWMYTGLFGAGSLAAVYGAGLSFNKAIKPKKDEPQ
jgi:hypothetical protein